MLNGQILVSAKFDLSKVMALADDSKIRFLLNAPFNFTDGSGSNQVTQIWADSRTLTAAASEELDLSGALTNAFGDAVTFSKIKGLLIQAGTNGDSLIVGGAAANGFIAWAGAADNTVKIRPRGLLALIAPDAGGYAVAAGTADKLKIANADASASATYEILLIGS